MPVIAAVLVALVMSFALKVRREAVLVADARLERKSWSWVAPDEVFTTSSRVWGVAVAMPTLPVVAVNMDCPDTYRLVEVADVEVEVTIMRLVIVEVELLTKRPPVNVPKAERVRPVKVGESEVRMS